MLFTLSGLIHIYFPNILIFNKFTNIHLNMNYAVAHLFNLFFVLLIINIKIIKIIKYI